MIFGGAACAPAPVVVLEVPANYLSVGQQFRPRLVAVEGGTMPATPITLTDAAGNVVAPVGEPATFALPRVGRYQLRAGGQTVALTAVPDASTNYGGVVGIASLGLAPGVGDYLQQHGFAVRPLAADDSPPRLILVGDPRLNGDDSGHDLSANYALLWKQVGAGASLLALEPPSARLAAFWPMNAPLVAAATNCNGEAFGDPFDRGLVGNGAGDIATLLHPPLAYDLTHESALDLYTWEGVRLPRPTRHSGYAGCYPLVTLRLGTGWVTISTLPLLEHFQDARARVYLMNLITAALHRRRPVPASPGMLWIMQRSAAALAALPAAEQSHLLGKLDYRPAPDVGVEPAPRLVPQLGSGVCWQSPTPQRSGASLDLDYSLPPAGSALSVSFGPDHAQWPGAYVFEARGHGASEWTALSPPGPVANGQMDIALPATAGWSDFRLRLTADRGTPWRVCAMDVH